MKLALAKEGGRYQGDGLDIQWPRGGGARDVVTVDDDRSIWSKRLTAAFAHGDLVEVSGAKATPKPAAASSGPTFKELQAKAKALGIKSVGVKKADLEAAIAAAEAH
jgi:hypothetical protein